VQVVVQTDIHCLNVIALQQLVKIGVGIRHLELGGDAGRFGLVDVGYGNNLRSGNFLVTLQMTFADLANTDDADADWFAGCCLWHNSLQWFKPEIIRMRAGVQVMAGT
jgi:phage terminase large subunit-like protein